MVSEMSQVEAPAATTDHRLGHSLRTILVPLDVPNGETVQPSVPAFTELAPFLPAAIPLPQDPRSESESPRLVAVRVFAAQGSGVLIHRTPAGLPTHPPPPQPPLDIPATCLSLWEVPEHGHVLACEDFGERSDERYGHRNANPIRNALEGDLATCLEPFDLTTQAPLTAVFPRLNSRLPGPSMYLPLRALVIPSHPARTTSTSMGIYIGKHVYSEQCAAESTVDREVYDCLRWVALSARHSDDRRTLRSSLRRYRRHPHKPGEGADVIAAVVDARLRHLELTSFVDHHTGLVTRSQPPTSSLQTLIGRFLERENDAGKELIQLCDIAEQALRLRTGSCRW